MRRTACPWMRLMLVLLSLLAICSSGVRADEVVMKSGERFSTDRVWKKAGKIRFNLQGLVVSVDDNEVATIIRSAHGTDAHGTASTLKQEPLTVSRHPGTVSGHAPRPEADAPPPAASFRHPRRLPISSHRNSESTDRVDRGTGLQGIEWLMSPDQIPDLKKIRTEDLYGGVVQYWRPDQPLVLDQVPVDGIVYSFWRKRLYAITVWADGRIGYERLKRRLVSRYGQGIRNRPDVERYVWLESGTQRMLEFDAHLNMGMFVMRSSKLESQIKRRYPSPSPGE